MSIYPLPQFESDLKELQEEDRRAYEALNAPKTIVVRFGAMKMVGEFPYDGSAKPGCGSKLVVRTHRGTELAEMLTSTCPNSGCSKSVSRQEILQYIENSGGRDYPFSTDGRVLRVATAQDLEAQSRLEQQRHELKMRCREAVEQANIPMKIVDAEPILGGERLTFYFMSEERIDFRDLVRELGSIFRARIELRQVGARDEARLIADYEKCGQYCCCKNFLKVLKPISMKSAKVQKATLDPLKISGRCGRLMCCLRYEDQTYAELQARLPRKKTRVGTPEGDGIVVDTQILTQLVLVQLDGPMDAEVKRIAVPMEELSSPKHASMPEYAPRPPARPPSPRGPGAPSSTAPRDQGQGPRGPSAHGPGAPPPPTSRNGPRPAPTQGRRPRPPEHSAPIDVDEVPTDVGSDSDIDEHERLEPESSPNTPRQTPAPGGDGRIDAAQAQGGSDKPGDGPSRRRRRRRRRRDGGGPGDGPRPGGPSDASPPAPPTPPTP